MIYEIWDAKSGNIITTRKTPRAVWILLEYNWLVLGSLDGFLLAYENSRGDTISFDLSCFDKMSPEEFIQSITVI